MTNHVKTAAKVLAVTGAVSAFPLMFASVAHADTPVVEGISIFATVDVGFAYQSAGVPLNGASVGGLEYQAFTTTRNFIGPQTTAAENALEQSKMGLAVSERLGDSGFAAVARLETAFNPLSGELTDACKSLAQNSGVGTPGAPQGQTANFDSSRCGQAINGVIYGGLSSKKYGTLTFGRQLSLVQAALSTYDPQSASPAFSFFGYSGFEAGAGTTEATRLDNSIAYAYSTPTFHIAALYSQGGQDTGVLGKTYMVQAGITHGGLQVDAVFARVNGGVNLRSSFDNPAAPLTGSPPVGLSAFISKNTSYNVMAKYTMPMADKAKLMLYAGYSHIEKAYYGYTSGGAQDGYPISVGVSIASPAKYDVEWVGARYTTAKSLSVSLGYYHISQNNWSLNVLPSGPANLGCSGLGLVCSGDFNEVSLVVDKPVVKHVDVYAGINYSVVTNGLAWGYASDQGGAGSGTQGSKSQTTVATGVRVKF